MESVIVLGAGLAGLGCARELPGCRVFEAAAEVGGHAASHPLGGAWFGSFPGTASGRGGPLAAAAGPPVA